MLVQVFRLLAASTPCIQVCTYYTLQVTKGMAAMKVNEEMGHGTIKAPPTHDAEADAQVLRKAMKGLGELHESAQLLRHTEPYLWALVLYYYAVTVDPTNPNTHFNDIHGYSELQIQQHSIQTGSLIRKFH